MGFYHEGQLGLILVEIKCHCDDGWVGYEGKEDCGGEWVEWGDGGGEQHWKDLYHDGKQMLKCLCLRSMIGVLDIWLYMEHVSLSWTVFF